jgi:hypothetical protein
MTVPALARPDNNQTLTCQHHPNNRANTVARSDLFAFESFSADH